MTTKAKDIMSSNVTVAHERMSIEEAVRLLVRQHITGMPVVDDEGRMVGVISEYDIIAEAARLKRLSADYLKKQISFSRKIEAVREDTPLNEVVRRFVKKKYRRLPVVDKKSRLVGIISRRDVIRLIYYRAKAV